MYDPIELREIMTAAAPEGHELSFRPMFGGLMAYADGKVFASLSNVGLGLKLLGQLRDEMLLLPDAVPLQYEPDGPPSKTYVVVPDTILNDRTALSSWIVRAIPALPPRRK